VNQYHERNKPGTHGKTEKNIHNKFAANLKNNRQFIKHACQQSYNVDA